MNPVRVGVLGCGAVAQMDYLPGSKRTEFAGRLEITAVADAVVDRARDVAHRFGVPAAFDGLEAMLDGAVIDAVLILTPIPLHYEQALACLEAGKHVYIQKTMCLTSAEADDIVGKAAQTGLKVCAAPGQMLLGPFRTAKSWIEEGAIGDICFARAHGSHPGHERVFDYGVNPHWYYQPGGGPVMDVAVYPLHALTGMLGPARRVTALSGIANRGRQWNGQPIEVATDDNMLLLLDFGDGRLASVDATYNMVASNTPQYEIYGTRGVLQISGWTRSGPALELHSDAGGRSGWFSPTPPLDAEPSPPMVHTLQDLLHFVHCIANDERPIPSAEHARHVIGIIEKAYASARTGVTQSVVAAF